MKRLEVRRLGLCEYAPTVALQEELVHQRRAGEIPDTLLLLEHEAVVTVGRTPPTPASLRSATPPHRGGVPRDDVLAAATRPFIEATNLQHKLPLPCGEGSARRGGGGFVCDSGIPVVETSRGGQATYHGPGQLVAYPIIDLRQWRTDLHWYLRQLETVGIETLRAFGLPAGNLPGHTGVWLGNRKIASIGIAVRGWVTYHGLALNVSCDMSGFTGFQPCGLAPETMVSMRELGLSVTVAEVGAAFAGAFQGLFGYDSMIVL